MAYVVYRNIETQRVTDKKFGYTSPLDDRERYRANNPYFMAYAYTTPPSPRGRDNLPAGSPWFDQTDRQRQLALNRLYSKVLDEVTGPQGELLTSALEWRDSLGMITKRAVQLTQAYKAMRSFKFAEVHRILQLPRLATRRQKRGLRKTERSFFVGDTSPTTMWLEYWMGWAPLMGDIGHALNTLQKPPPLNQHFKVGVLVPPVERKDSTGQPGDPSYQTMSSTITGHIGAYGKYRITNHNLLLANQLGFVNPALTAWQLVPFSFIVDWFANVGQVIGSLTDFVGIDIYDSGIGEVVRSSVSWDYSWREWDTGAQQWIYSHQQQSGVKVFKLRTPGPIPRPRLLVVPLERLSKTRAATAVSLLYEIFLRK